ncbi:MAG: NAD(P)H-dependent oxidoreductase [Saprospiraceae bacterium]|nr:NAD(P)H-dependent oxidoreductase [Pyrinomonadaceae bacterium]
MNNKPRILAFTGSLRESSYTKRVVQTALRGAENAGADVTFADLRDYPMPLFNSDDEETSGLVENALRFQELLAAHDGFLISSPEYNGSVTAAFKNAIDWASRSGGPFKRSDIFTGKFAGIMTASPGSFGGIRALPHVRGILMSVGVNVLSEEYAVSFVADKLDANGDLTEEKTKRNLEGLGAALVNIILKTSEAKITATATS